MRTAEAPSEAHLEHPALLYGTEQEFLGYMVPYVSAGIEAGDVVFVAAHGSLLPGLRRELGAGADAVRLADTDVWHPHPMPRLRAFHEFVTEEIAAGATRFRLAGEPVWPEGPPELIREWQRYESVLNRVLAPFPVTLVCLYDAARLDRAILETARRTHPWIVGGSTEGSSGEFVEPEDFLTRWSFELPPPPPSAVRRSGSEDLAGFRRFLEEQALLAGVGAERAFDLLVAANEALTNAVMHSDGVAAVWAWWEDGRFVCQIDDRGRGIGDPLAGYRPPSPEVSEGRGLWLARQLVDLVQIVPRSDGTSVRLHLRRA